jgi:hypothetical protein
MLPNPLNAAVADIHSLPARAPNLNQRLTIKFSALQNHRSSRGLCTAGIHEASQVRSKFLAIDRSALEAP